MLLVANKQAEQSAAARWRERMRATARLSRFALEKQPQKQAQRQLRVC
jgi:hypothetical protein